MFRAVVATGTVLVFGLAVWASPPPSTININGGMITNGIVQSGTAAVSGSGASRTITTGSAETIIKYDRFNVYNGWTINIQQPKATSATLNKVMGGCASEIMGTFKSNGQVFLVNPAGVFFGAGAKINMPKLVASGLYLSDDDFRKMAGLPLSGGKVNDNLVTFNAPGSGGRIMMAYDYGQCSGLTRPQFSTDQLYLIGTQVENVAKITGYTAGTKPYVVMAASTGKVLVSNWDAQNIRVTVNPLRDPTNDPTPPDDGCGDRHQNQEGKGHTLFQNGYAWGHYGECEDCLTTTLGNGDIYSLAVVDTSLVAMTALRDTNVLTDPYTGNGTLGRGNLGSTGNILLDSGRTTTIDKDITTTGGDIVAKAGLDNIVGGNVSAGGDVTMTATAGKNSVGGSVTGDDVAMTAGTNNKVTGSITAVDGDATIIAQGSNSAAAVSSTGTTTMTATTGNNTVTGDVSGSHVGLSAGGSNIVGSVHASGTDSIVMNAGTNNVVAGDVVAASGAVTMTATAGKNDVGGNVGGTAVTMTAGTDNLVGGGVAASTGDATLTAGGNNDVTGTVSGDNVTLTATGSNLAGGVDADGAAVLTAGNTNDIDGDVIGASVDMDANADNLVGGNVKATAGDVTMDAHGDNDVEGTIQALAGNVALWAQGNNSAGGVDASGDVTMTAIWGNNQVGGDVSGSNVTMNAGGDNKVTGSVSATDGDVLMNAYNGENDVKVNVTATGSVTMNAYAAEGSDEVLPGSGENEVGGYVSGTSVDMYADTNNEVTGDVTGTDGDVTMTAFGGHNTVGGTVSGDGINMDAYTDNTVGGSVTALDGDVVMTAHTGDNDVTGSVTATGSVDMYANQNNDVDGSVTAGSGVTITAENGYNWIGGSVSGSSVDTQSADDTHVTGSVTATAGNVSMTAGDDNQASSVQATGNVDLWAGDDNEITGAVTAGGNVDIFAEDGFNSIGGNITGQNVSVDAWGSNYIGGDITALTGDAAITSEYGENQFGGDVVAQGNVDIYGDYGNVLTGSGDQTFNAITGTLTVEGDTAKVTSGNLFMNGGAPDLAVDLYDSVSTVEGNIEITGNGDVQIGGDITAGAPCCGLGEDKPFVKIAQEIQEGIDALNYGVKIVSTNGQIYTDTPDNGINVVITGGSDQMAGRGVDLPYQAGQKAGVILMSAGDLKLGPDAIIAVNGTYYADGSVDDRAAVAFRNTSTWQGIPIDIGLYLKSTNGNISVDHLGQLNLVAPGTAAVDAYNSANLVNNDGPGAGIICNSPYYLYRLEVASRQVLWLQEAIDSGKLPYPSDFPGMEALMGGGTFVLRGGVNPEGIDGAWVLHGPDQTVTSYPILPAPVQTPTDDGCPVVLQAAAQELGQDPAVFRTGTFVSMKSTQPCSTCGKFVQAANVLKDADGKRMAALTQTLAASGFISSGAPISTEQFASLNQMLAEHTGDGTAYAAAGEWMNALDKYITVMTTEIGMSKSDARAIATGKYADSADESVRALVQMRIDQLTQE